MQNSTHEWKDEFLASMVIYQSIYYLLLSLTTGHSNFTKIPNKPIIFLHNGIHIFFKLKSRLATDNPPKLILCLSPNLCIRTYQINCKILKFLSLFILLWLFTSSALAWISSPPRPTAVKQKFQKWVKPSLFWKNSFYFLNMLR